MARAFDDLAADLTVGSEVVPRCTGEEMALHLGIARAQALTRNRPRLVVEAVAGLPVDRRDFDFEAASGELFQDGDVLMLFDQSLDGIEGSSNEANQALAWSTSLLRTGSPRSMTTLPATQEEASATRDGRCGRPRAGSVGTAGPASGQRAARQPRGARGLVDERF